MVQDITLNDSITVSESLSSSLVPTVDQFYESILTFLSSKGITPIVLLRNIKTISYAQVLNTFILIPKGVEVKNVWNGYIFYYSFDLIVASKLVSDFRTMKGALHKLIGNNLYNGLIYILNIENQKFDISVKGFYREYYTLTVNVVIQT
jgi:hypothetical protein